MRYRVILSYLRISSVNEGHPAKVFVDTGANCNTISRKFYEILVAQGLKCAFPLVLRVSNNINLVGGQVLHDTGDRVIVQTVLGISLGNFHSGQEFLVLDDDVEEK